MLNDLRIGIKIVAAFLTIGCLLLSLMFPNGATLMAVIPLIIITIGSLIEDLLDAKQMYSWDKKSIDPLVDANIPKTKSIKGVGVFTIIATSFGILLIIYCLFFSIAFQLDKLNDNELEPIALVYHNSSIDNTVDDDNVNSTSDEHIRLHSGMLYETYIFKPNNLDLSVRFGNLKGFGYNCVVIILVICFSILSICDIVSTGITYSAVRESKKGKR